MSLYDRLTCRLNGHTWEVEVLDGRRVAKGYHALHYRRVCTVCGREKEGSESVDAIAESITTTVARGEK